MEHGVGIGGRGRDEGGKCVLLTFSLTRFVQCHYRHDLACAPILGGRGEGVGKVREIRMAVLVPSEAPTVGLCTLCRHNFERNSEAKVSSIMLE